MMTRGYEIRFAPLAKEELGEAESFDRRSLATAIEVHLRHQPDQETRRRKKLSPPPAELVDQLATLFDGAIPTMWNLRVGDWRVIYAVEGGLVFILRIVKMGRLTTARALS